MNRHQLADAMVRGINAKGVVEDGRYYIATLGKLCHTCANGAALIGKFNGDSFKAEMEFEKAGGCNGFTDELTIFAQLLEIPVNLAFEIEFKHLNGMPIQQIAAWLKSSDEMEVKTI